MKNAHRIEVSRAFQLSNVITFSKAIKNKHPPCLLSIEYELQQNENKQLPERCFFLLVGYKIVQLHNRNRGNMPKDGLMGRILI